MNVLLLEDQGLVRAGMRSMIQTIVPQSRIFEASNFDEAIDVLTRQIVDVAFLDVDLRSQRSGYDVLVHIRSTALETRVVMLSATDDRDYVMACVAAGAAGYITKAVGDETVFARAVGVVMQDGVFLPSSVVGPGLTTDVAASGSTYRQSQLALSPRQEDVLYYVCQGLPNKRIAQLLGISEGTVRKTYLPELLRAFRATRRTELIVEVAKRGLLLNKPLAANQVV